MNYPDDFINKVIQGDCLEVMKDIPDNSVDLVVTDPPYNIGKRGLYKEWKEKNFKSIKEKWDNISEKDFKELYVNFIKECYRVLKKGGSIFISGTFHSIFDVKQILDSNGFRFRNFITWFKPNAMPMSASYEGFFAYSSEYICFYTKGNVRIKVWNYENIKKLNGGKQLRDTWILKTRTDAERLHPTQKPTSLYKILITACSNPNDVILDPFLGSGTTAVVAKMMNRRFIGIEISPEYCKIAEERLKKLPLRLDKFLGNNFKKRLECK